VGPGDSACVGAEGVGVSNDVGLLPRVGIFVAAGAVGAWSAGGTPANADRVSILGVTLGVLEGAASAGCPAGAVDMLAGVSLGVPDGACACCDGGSAGWSPAGVGTWAEGAALRLLVGCCRVGAPVPASAVGAAEEGAPDGVADAVTPSAVGPLLPGDGASPGCSPGVGRCAVWSCADGVAAVGVSAAVGAGVELASEVSSAVTMTAQSAAQIRCWWQQHNHR
jgi:hypothetical protein